MSTDGKAGARKKTGQKSFAESDDMLPLDTQPSTLYILERPGG